MVRRLPTCKLIISDEVQLVHKSLRLYRLLISALEDIVVNPCIPFCNLHMQNLYKGCTSLEKNRESVM